MIELVAQHERKFDTTIKLQIEENKRRITLILYWIIFNANLVLSHHTATGMDLTLISSLDILKDFVKRHFGVKQIWKIQFCFVDTNSKI